MANRSRKNIAADLKGLEYQVDIEETIETACRDGAVPAWGGVVVLAAHKNTGQSEPPASRRRRVRKTTWRSNEIGDEIGAQLRVMYDSVLGQPVPDRFLELLNRLERDTILPQASPSAPGEG